MELRHCRYFAAVAEERTITQAARKLHVSQPALSKQLKELESELGAPLFLREREGVRLTDAGQVFLVHARDLLARAAIAAEAVRPAKRRTANSVIVAYSPLAMPDFLGAALKLAKTSRLNVRLKAMAPLEQVDALRKGTIDVALLGNPPAAWKKEFATCAITSTPIVAVLPETHRLHSSGSLDLAALAKEEFVGVSEQSFPGRNECLREACHRAGFEPKITSFADSLTALTGMVAGGMGVALAPSHVASHPLTGVRILRLRRPRIVVESIAAWRKDGSAAASIEAIVEIFEASARPPGPARSSAF